MTSLRVTYADLDLAATALNRVGDDLRSVIGALGPVLTGGVVACGGDPASSALEIFQQALTESVVALASGFGDIGVLTAAASALYESTDDSVIGGS